MSFYLIGRLSLQWRSACGCLPPVRSRVFIMVLLVMTLFVVILIGHGYNAPTALGLAAAAGAVAASSIRGVVRLQLWLLNGWPGPWVGAR